MHATTITNRFTSWGCLLVIGLLMGAFAWTPLMAHAANINVTTSADEIATNGKCSLREAIRAANLNQKVDSCPAGSSGSTDNITIPAGTYTLTISGQDENDALKGDLDLKGALSITGAGAGVTIIDGNDLDRVFDVRDGATVTINNLTIRNGNSRTGTGGGLRNNGTLTVTSSTIKQNHADASYGGGISNVGTMALTSSTINNNSSKYGGGIRNNGKLTIDTSTVSNNYGDMMGGGIYNTGTLIVQHQTVISQNGSEGESDASGGGIYNSNKLTATDSTIKENRGDYGGGMFNTATGSATLSGMSIRANVSTSDLNSIGAGIANFGDLMLANSAVVSNTTTVGLGAGGGVYNNGGATIKNTSIMSNTASYPPPYDFSKRTMGGGIMNDGTMTISTSTVSQNTASDDGGGIYNNGTLTLDRSMVGENMAGVRAGDDTRWGHAGGIKNDGALTITASIIRDNGSVDRAGGIWNTKLLTIDRSTISGNTGGDYAGGIDNEGTLTLTSSTISGNRGYNGGGLANYDTATLTNVTVSGNIALDVAPGILNQGDTLTIANSTIVGNRYGFADDGVTGAGLDNRGGKVLLRNSILAAGTGNIPSGDCEGTITSQGYNLIQNPGCTIVGDKTGNKLNANPKLGPLQNNGGPTWTHALLSGSPAIDSANPATPGSGGNACPAKDQRGYARPKDGNGDGKSRCDIGAFERQSASSTMTSTGSASDLANPPDPASEPNVTDMPDPTNAPDPTSEPDAAVPPESTQALYHVLLPYVAAP